MRKKSIAVIINGGIGVGFGNEGVICLTELCECLAVTCDVTVFSLVKVDKDYQPKGYQLYGPPKVLPDKLLFAATYMVLKYIQLHIKRRFDLIHGFWAYPAGALTVLIGKIFALKTVITFMGGEIANIPSIRYGLFRKWYSKKLIKVVSRQADCIVALSHHYANMLTSSLTYKRLEIIPFGVKLEKFPATCKPLASPYNFLYLGNLNRVKNLPVLIETFRRISDQIDAHLDIVGFDTLHGSIPQLVSQYDLSKHVSFHDRQLNGALSRYYQQAHFLLHTSLWESQAVVVNEAMASGVVVCGTRVGLLDDLQNTITIVAPDSQTLAGQVLALVNNPEGYSQRRNNGIEWSRHHDFVTQSAKYLVLYNDLLKDLEAV